MHLKSIILKVTVAGLLVSCSRNQEKSTELIQANAAHLESIAIAGKVENTLDSLRGAKPDSTVSRLADSLAGVVESWKDAVIEVPGFAHQHDHGGHHEHKPAPDMTDESMLEYQLQAKKAILEVKAAADSLASPKTDTENKGS